MKLNNILQMAVAIYSMTAISCSDENAFVLRNDDHVDLAYSTAPGTFTVCTNGAWTVTTNATWFTVSPASGTGDGNTREVVTITPSRNTGAARTDSVYLDAAGRHLGIGINQDDGSIKLGTPTFVGNLTMKKPAKGCYISIPYSKGVEGQQLTAKTTMSGVSTGLVVADYTYTADASGAILVPVTGTPATSGTVTFTVSTGMPGADDVSVSTIVAAAAKVTILEQTFDKFIYGGDVANMKAGVWPSNDGKSVAVVSDATGKKIYDDSAPIVACVASADGSNDVFLTMSESYRESRNMTGWNGSKVYERPGYIKCGTASAAGFVTTPAFSSLDDNGGTQDVIVTFNAMAWYQNTGAVTPLKFTVSGGGTLSSDSYDLPERDGSTVVPWSTISIIIKDATSATQLRIEPASTNKKYFRFMLDNLKVTTTGL